MSTSEDYSVDFATRLGRVIVLFVLLVVAVVLLVVHVLAWRWATQPFMGLLVEPTLVLSPLQGRGWARLQLDPPLEQPDRLIAIDGQPVKRYRDIEAVLSQRAVGDTVWILVERPDGDMREEQITLTRFPMRDMFLIFIPPYLAGLAYLAIGIWVYWVRGWGRAGQVFTALCASFALVLCCIFDLNTTHRLAVLWCAAMPFAAATAMHLAMVFPKESRFVKRVPVLRFLPYLPAIFLAYRSIFSVYDISRPWMYIDHWRDNYLFAAVSILFMLGLFVYRLVKPPSALVRQQSRVILLGSALAFLPVVPWLLLNVAGYPVPFLSMFFAPFFAAFPVAIAYAILRYRLLDIDQLLSQGLAYGALTFLVVAAYFILINGLSHFFAVRANDPILLSLFVLALVLLFNPLRNWAQRLVDRVFFREIVRYSTMLREFDQKLANTLNLDVILSEISRRIEQTVQPSHQWIYLYDEGRASYVGQPIGQDRYVPLPSVLIPQDSVLAQWLETHQEPLHTLTEEELSIDMDIDAEVEAGDEWRQMSALGAVLYVPMHTPRRLCGWLALGPRRSKLPYHHRELDFLSALARKSASVVENARRFANMQRDLTAVSETKRRMEELFSSIASGVITTNAQNRVVLFNRASETILGLKASEVIGHHCQQALHCLGSDLQNTIELVKCGEMPMITYEIQPDLPTRGAVYLRVKVSPLEDSRGTTNGVAIVVDDLTKRRQLKGEVRRIRAAFERYVSPVVVEQLISNPERVRLGGVRQEITSFYADIRNFTAFSERSDPEFQIEVLNKHLTLTTGAILAHEGTLDKFVGDGTMAIFNAPVKRPDHTLQAVRAALAVQRAVQEHHAQVSEQEQLEFGIGIAMGQAVVGNIGSVVLQNFTAIGDCVNFSARLSSLAKPGSILISAGCYERVREYVEAIFIGHIQVKGHSQPDPVYEVLGLRLDSGVS